MPGPPSSVSMRASWTLPRSASASSYRSTDTPKSTASLRTKPSSSAVSTPSDSTPSSAMISIGITSSSRTLRMASRWAAGSSSTRSRVR